jgi:hypothetical protein
MAKTVTLQDVEEYFSKMTKEQADDWVVRMGLKPDPTKIEYKVCAVTYDWLKMCKEWEEKPKHWDGGQFCGGIETYVYTHPILPEKDITFILEGDIIIECYATGGNNAKLECVS